MCIHCSLHKQKCRLKSTTTDGWRHFGQLEQPKSSELFPIQSEKSQDSGFFACDLWKKCIMPSSRKQITEIKGEGMIVGYLLPPLVHHMVTARSMLPLPWDNKSCCLRVILFSYPPTPHWQDAWSSQEFFSTWNKPFQKLTFILKNSQKHYSVVFILCP